MDQCESVCNGGYHAVKHPQGKSSRLHMPCRFFLSLEDNLFRIFGGDKIKGLMSAFRVEDLPMESQMLSDALDTAQKRVENYFFDIRK